VNRLLLVVGDVTPATTRLALAGSPDHVHVVATTVVGPFTWLANGEEGAHVQAEMRALEAERALEGLVEVSSEAGAVDPVEAAGTALSSFRADDITVTGAAADDGLELALAPLGLPVYRVGPRPGKKARMNRELRELAGGRDARKLIAFLVGVNIVMFAACIAISLLAIVLLWLVGAFSF
jgi:hypothetical protein